MIGPRNIGRRVTLDPKNFGAQMYELATRLGYHIDEFCGGGGASEGYRQATGREVSLVVNHKVEAVNMHRINHSKAKHFCQDVFAVDPIAALKALGYTDEEIATAARICGFLIRSGWFSPDCKHFSKAKGAALLDKRIRSLVWIMLKWCGRGGGGNFRRGPACPMVMFMENVEEFKTFGPLVADRCPKTGRVIKRDGTVAAAGERVKYWDQKLVPCKKRMGLYFKRFIRWLQAFGATVEWRELRACDYGAATIRNRLFLVARFDGLPIEFPEPTHGSPESEEVMSGRLLPWVPAAACLEFNHECPSVLMTKKQAQAYTKRTGIKIQRPLVKASHRRLAKGVKRHVIDAKKVLVVLPGGAAHFISENANASHHRNFSAIEPLRTICAQVKGGHFSLGAVFLAQHNTGAIGHSGQEPLSTIVGRGTQQNVVFCSMVKYYGADQDPQMEEPLHTITTKDRFGLVEVQGSLPELTPALAVKARRVARWLRANGVKVGGEFAMVGVYVIVDVGMRMLKPRELYRAQGFPESYVIDRCLVETKSGAWIDRPLSGTEQIHMCGNSVSPPVAAALIRANLSTPTFEKLAA